MTFEWVVDSIACAGQLAFAVLAFWRVQRGGLGLPVGFAALVLFGWNFADLGQELTGEPEWDWVDMAISPWTTPAAFYFVLAYLGMRRRFRALWLSSVFGFGALSAVAAAAFFYEEAAAFLESGLWAAAHLILAIPFVFIFVGLLLRHLRHHSEPEERGRTRLVLAALAITAAFGTTDLWADLGLPVPRLGALATFASVAILFVVALRYDLLRARPSGPTVVLSLAIAALAVFGYLLGFLALGSNITLLLFTTVTVTLAVVGVTARLVGAGAADRERQQRLAFLGRVSDQMAHDLQNPLAAIKGAAQFLAIEHAEGRGLEAHVEFVALIEEEADRLARLIQRYRRIGRVEPELEPLDLRALVVRVIEAARLKAPDGIELRADGPNDPVSIDGDEDLLLVSLENAVKNAIESIDGDGSVSVALDPEGRLEVIDTGRGIDPRNRERIFDDFFTTKATGSGLGLPFLRRVVEAHGGRVTIEDNEPRGTRLTMDLTREQT